MPELEFRGKEFVRNHHLTVPYRPLIPDPSKSIGDASLDNNLIIHGDNLHALKALLPQYAGKVDCIVIDPPYNTGNEGWSYSDRVNSPLTLEWLKANPINVDDQMRHDKWCAMMWPRLKLLKELLREHGTIWITIDDVEVHHLRSLLDEVFGEDNFVATVCWQKKYATANDTVDFSDMHDFVLVYTNERPESKNKRDRAVLARLERTEDQNRAYRNPDDDPRGPWKPGDYTCNKSAEERPSLYYPIKSPKTKRDVWPDKKRVWAYDPVRHQRNVHEGRVWWGLDGKNEVPSYKRYLSEVSGLVASTWWTHDYAGHTDEAKKELRELFSERAEVFATPKPTRLIERVLDLAIGNKEDALVLDSFAGSGTTGHAVLKRYPSHRFILVEQEEYADRLTAERVRRAINGYPFEGTQRETLFEKKLTWTDLKQSEPMNELVSTVTNENAALYDSIKPEVLNGLLRVVGQKTLSEHADGLGGSFTYCTLGDPVDVDEFLTGKGLPSRPALSQWLLYTAFGKTESNGKPPKKLGPLKDRYVATIDGTHVWLLYEPNIKYLQESAALTLELARQIADTDRHSKHLVFSPVKYVSQKTLRAEKIPVEHALLPFSLAKLERT